MEFVHFDVFIALSFQALAMEKSMRKLKDEPFDNQNIFKFLQKISKDLDDMLIFKDHENLPENLGQSLEDLSLSIRNRMKVEKAEEEIYHLPKNSLMEQLSKFEAIFSDLHTPKIEE